MCHAARFLLNVVVFVKVSCDKGPMPMDNSRIEELIENCWFATSGIQIEPTSDEEMSVTDSLCVATVIFTGGEREGSLTVAMQEDLSKEIAGKMFELSVDELSFDDIRDSMGEVANVLAGNLKSDFFRDNELSKPLVMQGGSDLLTVFMVEVIFQKVFLTGNKKQLVIQVCQTQ